MNDDISTDRLNDLLTRRITDKAAVAELDLLSSALAAEVIRLRARLDKRDAAAIASDEPRVFNNLAEAVNYAERLGYHHWMGAHRRWRKLKLSGVPSVALVDTVIDMLGRHQSGWFKVALGSIGVYVNPQCSHIRGEIRMYRDGGGR